MRMLFVSVEINGIQTPVGIISGTTVHDAQFTYSKDYLSMGMPAISISLPLSDRSFSPEATKKYFEGLLPEGFARKSVANFIHTDENDYLTILEKLGSECLGAIRISSAETIDKRYERLSLEEVKALAKEGVSKSTELVTEAHLSLTGASGKVGLYYDEKNSDWYKPLGSAPSTHIVKQSHVRLSGIVTNEQLSLLAAAELGINVPESFIINTGAAKDEDILFATKRYDRLISKDSKPVNGLLCPFRLHQEDFAQALGISSMQKYESGTSRYLPELFRILRNYSSDPIADQLKLWDIIVFDFLVGNTDNHIKNLSLLYSSDLKKISLAPAYDIISTAIYQGSSRDMAIGIGGERNLDEIGRKHFSYAASEAGLNPLIALKHFDTMAGDFERALRIAAEKLEDEGYENVSEIKDRILVNGGYGHL
ncbi:MAG: HipA domain-containing protein [Clostridia bacterium]|nr:HipA domain-containing protein [Clostridia bacterium]